MSNENAINSGVEVRTEFCISEMNFIEAEKRVLKLAAKAEKLGLDAPRLNVLEKMFLKDETNGRQYKALKVEVIGKAPRLNDFTLIAAIEHGHELGNIVHCFPGQECPVEYRDVVPLCEHCGYSRKRSQTYVLRNENGEYIQIGRNCLADFVRSADSINNLLGFYEALASFDAFMGKLQENSDNEKSGRSPEYYSVHQLLELTCCVIDNSKLGYFVSKKMGFEKGLRPTVYDVEHIVNKNPHFVHFPKMVTEENKQEAQAAIDWILGLFRAYKQSGEDKETAESLSDYLYNLGILVSEEWVRFNKLGMVCSLIGAHRRHLESQQKKVEEKAEGKKESEHVGTVGQREEFVLVLKKSLAYEGSFGTTFINLLEDGMGNMFKWTTSSETIEGVDLNEGEVYKIVAMVKEHAEYKGIKQTVITRPKLAKEKPAKKPRKSKKTEVVEVESLDGLSDADFGFNE